VVVACQAFQRAPEEGSSEAAAWVAARRVEAITVGVAVAETAVEGRWEVAAVEDAAEVVMGQGAWVEAVSSALAAAAVVAVGWAAWAEVAAEVAATAKAGMAVAARAALMAEVAVFLARREARVEGPAEEGAMVATAAELQAAAAMAAAARAAAAREASMGVAGLAVAATEEARGTARAGRAAAGVAGRAVVCTRLTTSGSSCRSRTPYHSRRHPPTPPPSTTSSFGLRTPEWPAGASLMRRQRGR